MTTLMDSTRLQERLAELVAKHEVAGAAIGVYRDGETVEAAAGLANLDTGVEVTTDTAFQIGSQGKMWTATALMAFVDEGLVDLDVPVRTYLPDFTVADPGVSAKVTLRHLLTHTSGIDGEHFEDTGQGDDSLERYVATCAKLEQTHPLGATMSYCNTGYPVIARVMAVVAGKSFEDILRERLIGPLGLEHTSLFADEAIMHRVAVGHIPPAPNEPLVVAPVWMFSGRALTPMGGEIATVGDVLKFARLHLDRGRTPDGAQVISAESAGAMLNREVEMPDPYVLGSHWGLGVILFDWDGHFVYGHDGGTLGQSSRLRILPEANAAITLLTNGGDAESIYRTLFSDLLDEIAGVRVPAPLEAPANPPKLDLSKYAGVYERLAIRYELEAVNGHLEGRVLLSGPLAEIVPDTETKLTMTPVDETTFLVLEEGAEHPEPSVFYEFDAEGRPTYLHSGARANRRQTSG